MCSRQRLCDHALRPLPSLLRSIASSPSATCAASIVWKLRDNRTVSTHTGCDMEQVWPVSLDCQAPEFTSLELSVTRAVTHS